MAEMAPEAEIVLRSTYSWLDWRHKTGCEIWSPSLLYRATNTNARQHDQDRREKAGRTS